MADNLKRIKVYVASKVHKDSVFGTHDWRDSFIDTLASLSGLELQNIDPTKSGINQDSPETVVGGDSYMISRADVVIVYLSDDISVGGSQEILIAKYFTKPVIGLAPAGGKFNGSIKEYLGQIMENYRDPFVFSTCDVVCDDIEGVAKQLKTLSLLKPKSIDLIGELKQRYEQDFLKLNNYLSDI